MDSWDDCRSIPAGHYDRTVLGCHCKQFDQGPQRLRIIPHSDCRTIRLVDHLGWRVCICLLGNILLRLTVIARLLFLPETPRYLIKMDKYDQAAKSLGQLRRLPVDHPAIVEELNEVQANHLYEMSLGKSTYVECFKGTLGKRLLTGCLLQALQQLTGVNFIFCRHYMISNSGYLLTWCRLRNTILPESRFRQPFRHSGHHQLCQCRLHVP
jgi:hypothetical protein